MKSVRPIADIKPLVLQRYRLAQSLIPHAQELSGSFACHAVLLRADLASLLMTEHHL